MGVAHLLASAAAALLLLGGCGGAAPSDAGDPAGATAAPANGGVLTVDQTGAAKPRTLWYVRIETLKAEPVFETAFPGRKISLTRRLKPGQYRVISWWRTCEGVCPTAGEKGLGPLENVCGAPVTIVSGRKAKATVSITADGCAIDVR